MNWLAAFLVRLVAYALSLGIAARIAAWYWAQLGLDGSIQLQRFHDLGVEVMVISPLVLALFGVGALRQAAFFIAAFLIGAALTAPLACAHFAGT